MSVHSWFSDRTAVLATMHQKERVIAPIFHRELGVKVIVPANFDTDRFGTFTRDIARTGNQLETARHKAENVLAATGESLAIASEGSFFPHPAFPFVACDRELVLLRDRVNNLEIVGEELSTETNYAHKSVQTIEEALEFAQKVGFPEHALVVMTDRDTCNRQEIFKGINQPTKLIEILNYILQQTPTQTAYLETDMRAMYNPTRMKVIARATHNLIKKIARLCPQCSCPGFDLIEQQKGLLCGLCFTPTSLILAEIYQCQKCSYQQKILHPQGTKFADPSQCMYCNP